MLLRLLFHYWKWNFLVIMDDRYRKENHTNRFNRMFTKLHSIIQRTFIYEAINTDWFLRMERDIKILSLVKFFGMVLSFPPSHQMSFLIFGKKCSTFERVPMLPSLLFALSDKRRNCASLAKFYKTQWLKFTFVPFMF